jgi:para-nitrobenzyl esterase
MMTKVQCTTRRGSRHLLLAAALLLAWRPLDAQVKTSAGTVKGTMSADGVVSIHRGIPFAAPPVGALRWKAPQPVVPWQGERDATRFGARCMQAPLFSDMIFRDEMSEDCLYLNVWSSTRDASQRLPVMVWIYGGGFQAGSASEPRQDGERLSRLGVVIVSVNYRLGAFGFLAHPSLTSESGTNSSGNYGLFDQIAALEWVKRNIAAFGGDPANVTIFGESAGSFSVSALVASPLARGLFQKAIGESGSMLGAERGAAPTLQSGEAAGLALQEKLLARTIDGMRDVAADDVLKAAQSLRNASFGPIVDGRLLPRSPQSIYEGGAQNKVALLAGWNADEVRSAVTMSPRPVTVATFTGRVRSQLGAGADAVLAAYPATTDAEAAEAMADYISDTFISHGTWRWLETHRKTSGAPVYRYLFRREIPVAPGKKPNGEPITARDVGARHAGEIEYVFGTLESVPKVTWERGDRALSELMMRYWSNFARSGNPNGAGLPNWPRYTGNGKALNVMELDVVSKAAPDRIRARYEALDAAFARRP